MPQDLRNLVIWVQRSNKAQDRYLDHMAHCRRDLARPQNRSGSNATCSIRELCRIRLTIVRLVVALVLWWVAALAQLLPGVARLGLVLVLE